MAMLLAQLRMLAQERQPGKRRELLRALADTLCDPAPDFAAAERARFDDVIVKVLDDIEPRARREFAKWLAAYPDAPHRVVVRLAGDVAAVAAPVLIASPVLGEDDLAALAQTTSQDHLVAIARRDRLSERITDLLAERGDAAVLVCLAQNPGARFSAPGAAALIDKARTRPTLWWRLFGRGDLPVGIADGPAAANADAMAGNAPPDAAAAGARPLDELADLLADGTLWPSEAVIELADANRADDLAVLVCSRAGGDAQTFLLHLFAPDETAVMATCRAAGLDLESFSAVMRLRHRHHAIGAGDVARLLRAFGELPVPPTRDRPDRPAGDPGWACHFPASREKNREITESGVGGGRGWRKSERNFNRLCAMKRYGGAGGTGKISLHNRESFGSKIAIFCVKSKT